MAIKYKIFPISILTLVIGLCSSSCKKYPDNPPYFQEIDSLRLPPNRKVLIIGVDGFASAATQAIAPAKLTGILQKSKYAWDEISDRPSNSATVWKTLTSAVQSSTHGITDSSFAPAQNDDEHQVIKRYPSIFNLLLSSTKPELTTGFIGRWNKIPELLIPEVDAPLVLNTDQLVKDSLIARLKSVKTADVTLVQFSDPVEAGIQGGFDASAAPYKAAIEKLAGNLDEIINTLKARPGYNKSEEWLVIITGTNGGVNNSYGNGTVPERTVPVIYYNERFKPLEFSAQGINLNVTLTGSSGNVVRARINDPSNLSMGTGSSGARTVQFKMLSSTKSQYPVLISNSSENLNYANGWSVYTTNSGYWQLIIGNRKYETAAWDVLDGNWHTCTFVLYDSVDAGGTKKRWIKRFTDGKRIPDTQNRDISSFNLVNTLPLTLGFANFTSSGNTGALPVNFQDIVFYNTALTDAEVTAANCAVGMNAFPQKDKMIGFWPCNDGFQSQFSNLVNPVQPFVLSGNFAWANLGKIHCSMPNPTAKPGTIQTQFQLPDVARQVFYWLGVTVPSSWGIGGTKWLDAYETEFYKQ
ncbi:DUF4983 domain-containing protein [Niabella sp. CC-SYL272]|uniref:DUF4983 domain-containing protein n=1 Tax=Niabella agricola TaxID=2891571 RepID=UPI001F3EDC41|nr:DUF4983 domain-containing protein [Niabella agricola]MCF3110393.1 DUF4983 domain-containing protein [Niabella agricola]